MVAGQHTCPCRQAVLSESELFHGYRVPHEPLPETPLSADQVRERYVAQRSTSEVLRELAEQERRLSVGGRT